MQEHRAVAAPFCTAIPQLNKARRLLLLAACALLCLNSALNPTHLHAAAATAYDRAQQLRSQLDAKPAPRRTRTDYTLVIDAYRVIYHGMPANPHAVDSILAVAELLEDEGHVFRDVRMFTDAINQYEYFRQHYPSNPRRVQALLAEAHVEQHDLRDPKAAEIKYRELIERYPNTAEATEAANSLKLLSPGYVPPAPPPAAQQAVANSPAPSVTSGPTSNPPASTTEARTKPSAAQPLAAKHRAPSRYASAHISASPGYSVEDKAPSADLLGSSSTVVRRGAPPVRLSGIRQLVTDDGVQLVFDLSGPVDFRTGRLTTPTRLYFDLENTHIDRSLTLHPMVVSADPAQTWLVHRIRAAQFTANMSRVVLEVDDSADAYAQLMSDPWRLMIDLHSVAPPPGTVAPPQTTANMPDTTTPAATAQTSPGTTPQYASEGVAADLPLDLPATLNDAKSNNPNAANAHPATPTTNVASNPAANTPVMNTVNMTHTPAPGTGISQATAAEPTTDGNSTLVRALGLKINRVVIDPGHGGNDTGTIGPGGLLEKDVVLDIALRLGALLQQRGLQVVYTRNSDVYVPLEERTAIATRAHGDLFISIHGNSSPESNVRGVETYYLSLTNQKDALAVASRENATSTSDIHDLSDIVKRITLNDKLDESREFALDVQQQLYAGLVSGNSGLKDRGIKKAPFVVLIGANMPSILTEVSFLTDSKDAHELRDPKYRERIAESLFRGISEYIGSLSNAPVQPRRKK